jgi:hypothetical protein
MNSRCGYFSLFVTGILVVWSGCRASADGGAPALIPEESSSTTIVLNPKARNLATIEVNGSKALVAFPDSDAPPGTTATVSSASAAQMDSSVGEKINLTFSHDVTFNGYPAFLTDAPPGTQADQFFEIAFDDGKSIVPLRKIAPAPRQALFFSTRLTFSGGFFTKFYVKANRTYSAVLTSPPGQTATTTLSTEPQTLLLPPTAAVSDFVHANIEAGYGHPETDAYTASAGVTGALALPAAAEPGPLTVTTSDTVPEGVRGLVARDALPVPYYIDMRLPRGAAFRGPLTLTVIVPLTHAFVATDYNLAAYDAHRRSWQLAVAAPALRQGDVLRLTMPPSELKLFNTGGRYVLSLYAIGNAEATGARKPVVAVLGDSISVLTTLPQSAAAPPNWNCTTGWAGGGCEYTVDSTYSWPGVVAQLAGADVYNLARYDNAETTVGSPSWIDNQVPFIPRSADFVVFEGGRADLSLDKSLDPSNHVEQIVNAIAAQAPRAKIVFLSPLCIGGDKTKLWADAELKLAPRYGSFIDSNTLASCADILMHTDNLHESPLGNREIGEAVARVIDAMWANAGRDSARLAP